MLHNIASSYLNSYNLGGSNTVSDSHLSGAGVFVLILGLIIIVFYIFTLWKVFVKAGKPGWAAIIPLYNFWVLFEISGKPGWWALFVFVSFIPFIGWIPVVILEIIAAMELAKRFGKSTTFGVLLLWLLSFIGYPILAFSDAKYTLPTDSAAADDMPPSVPPMPQAPIVH